MLYNYNVIIGNDDNSTLQDMQQIQFSLWLQPARHNVTIIMPHWEQNTTRQLPRQNCKYADINQVGDAHQL